MAKLTLLCALLSLGILTSDATTQHMICETVKDVFSGEGTQQSVPRPVIFPFSVPYPVDKIGPKGEKGAPGASGIPGTVNQLDLETLIDEKVNAATATLREKMEKLQIGVEKCNATEVPITTPGNCINATDPCSDGFVYRENCYFTAIVNDGRKVDLSKATQMCIDQEGKIADIFNLEHQEMAEKELEKSIEGNYLEIWLATTYSTSARTLHMTNGMTKTASLFRWYSSRFPTSLNRHTNIILNAKPFPRAGGIFNQRSWFYSHGALCVK